MDGYRFLSFDTFIRIVGNVIMGNVARRNRPGCIADQRVGGIYVELQVFLKRITFNTIDIMVEMLHYSSNTHAHYARIVPQHNVAMETRSCDEVSAIGRTQAFYLRYYGKHHHADSL